jgi:uracil-DNA glycosylase family 4
MFVPTGMYQPLVGNLELDDRIKAPIPQVAEWFQKANNFPTDIDALMYLLFSCETLPVKDGKEGDIVHLPWIPGGKWLEAPARGPTRHHRVMVVSKMPGAEEAFRRANFVGNSGKFLYGVCEEVGIDPRDWYVTNVVRFQPPDGGKSLKYEHLKECAWLLKNEIALVRPQFLLLLGADAVKAVCGRNAMLTKMRSHYYAYKDASELGDTPKALDEADAFNVEYGIKVMATIHPVAVLKENGHREGFVRDMKLFGDWLANRPLAGVDFSKCDYRYCHQWDELAKAVDEVINGGYTDVAVDCEWVGADHRTGFLRSVQFSWKEGSAAVAVMSDSNGYFDASDYLSKFKVLERLFTHPKIQLIGHNMRADARWLEHRGLPVMSKLSLDTMLADHILNENAEHGLDACAVRYTNMGRYDVPLYRFLEQNNMTQKHLKANGFKGIPDEILLPYAACDADATLRVANVLKERLHAEPELNECFERIVMPTNYPIHEIEMTGFLIDTDRMANLTLLYGEKKEELLHKVRKQLGREEFNPRSAKQMQQLLFGPAAEGGFGLEPYKTTGKPSRMWSDLKEFERKRHSPSTDAETLEALADQNPVVSMLHDFKVIDQVTKSFLKEGEEDEETQEIVYSGGLMSELSLLDKGGDGRIRTSISQMSETGRWKSSRPNLQNLPSKQNKEMNRIVGEDVSTIRSCFIASPGCVLVEADYKSAEIFTLGYLANCEKLLKDAVGDLHARGAVSRFGAEKWDGYDSFKPPPEEWLKKYKALRIASKAVVFGIPYQRGAAAIARQIVKDTKGAVPCDIDRAKAMIAGFYADYPEIREYVLMCQNAVKDPGWLTNPYHRRRRFMAHDTEAAFAAQQREAVNFPIQSTVADAMNTAAQNFYWWRDLNPRLATYKILLAIHDAAMLEVPVQYLEVVTKQVVPQCMRYGSVVPSWQPTDRWKPTKPFSLDVDIAVSIRWGEDATAEELKERGVSDAMIEEYAA